MDPMEQIKVTFFQECDEQLADLEAGLLALEAGEGDGETINAVFRAVHSVKGGAGAFGFDPLVKFAHVFETTLDLMRSGRLEVESETLKVMLRAADLLSDFVAAARGLSTVDEVRAKSMVEELAALTRADGAEGAEIVDALDAGDGDIDGLDFVPVQFTVDEPPAEAWALTMTPTTAIYANGHDAGLILRELSRLGACTVSCDLTSLPAFDALDPECAYVSWRVQLSGDIPEGDILDIFDFLGDSCPITLTREGESVAQTDVGAVDIASLLRMAQAEADAARAQLTVARAPKARSGDDDRVKELDDAPRATKDAAKAPQAGRTIRVDLDRVDRLIDLVGELVINQAMLAQRVGESGVARSSTVAIGLDELEQLTREIQDSVMAIRAQPVKSVFQRMPRLVREIAGETGKSVRLVTEGENTEVDKTVIECLSDPITHMLRNAIDHGLETPEDRIASGKAAEGVVRLAALHRSGRIVIEVSDDGRGINRAKVREIAIKKGLIAADAMLSDEEIDNLIFMPGFSTADAISNISGRGVGMDVVKRSIQALGGRIAITSQPGKGSAFTLSLPLTLAVLDGMVVTAADHALVAPLTAIIETLRPKDSEVRKLGPRSAVLCVRGAHVPIVDVGVALGWRDTPIDPTSGVILLVESEVGGRAALVVDAIQGQRQVVIKSLEANYQRVEAIAAATILGDGRVALILDVDAMIDTRFLDRVEPHFWAQAS